MNWKSSFAKSLGIATMTVAMATAAHAAALRTFVSGFGNDSNTATNCSHAQPCRTFAMAVTVTAPGGEIEALDPAGYGPITINGPLTLVGLPGAAINVPSGGLGVYINAGASDIVHLDGLLVDGGNVGVNGIVFGNGKLLTVENCTVRNMTGDGLVVGPTFSTASVAVSNSYFDGNGNAGILIETLESGAVSASVDRTGLYGNAIGVSVSGQVGTGALYVAVTDSVATQNMTGFAAFAQAGHSATNLSLTHVLAEGNTTGIQSDGPATLWLAQSTVTGNGLHGFAVTGSGGVINTYQDNYIANNGLNTGSLTTIGKQ